MKRTLVMVLLTALAIAGPAHGQVTLPTPFNEGSTIKWTFDFKDVETNLPVTPTAVDYRVQSVGTAAKAGTVLVPQVTVAGPFASSMAFYTDIVIPNNLLASKNIDSPDPIDCVITMHYDYDPGRHGVGFVYFKLRNAPGWPFP